MGEYDTEKWEIADGMANGDSQVRTWILENWPVGRMPCSQCGVFWLVEDLPIDRVCLHCIEENNEDFDEEEWRDYETWRKDRL
jgi:hypothetical protein